MFWTLAIANILLYMWVLSFPSTFRVKVAAIRVGFKQLNALVGTHANTLVNALVNALVNTDVNTQMNTVVNALARV